MALGFEPYKITGSRHELLVTVTDDVIIPPPEFATGFIGLYGYVKYSKNTRKKYPPFGPCEVGLCRLRLNDALISQNRLLGEYREKPPARPLIT